MNYSSEELGKMIKRERKKRGLSQDKLGQKISVVGKQISEYEKGRVTPPVDNLFKLCEVFGCELGYLLGEEEYAAGTRGLTFSSEYLGLSPEAIKQIRKLTGRPLEKNVIKHISENNTNVLNLLLNAKSFGLFVSALTDLDVLYQEWKAQQQAIQSEIDTLKNRNLELYNEALKQFAPPYPEEENPSEELMMLTQSIEKIIDKMYTSDQFYEREIRFSRFKIQEILTELLNDVYSHDDELKAKL